MGNFITEFRVYLKIDEFDHIEKKNNAQLHN